MKNKLFTPGPWRINGQDIRVKVDDRMEIVARAFSRFHEGNPIKQKNEEAANARLIGKAPEMYELLKRYLAEHSGPKGRAQKELITLDEVADLLAKINGDTHEN